VSLDHLRISTQFQGAIQGGGTAEQNLKTYEDICRVGSDIEMLALTAMHDACFCRLLDLLVVWHSYRRPVTTTTFQPDDKGV
jgi:hypothetical protein